MWNSLSVHVQLNVQYLSSFKCGCYLNLFQKFPESQANDDALEVEKFAAVR